MVETASLYDNFCKTGNDVIYDRENFIIGAFYNITKNQDNSIKTVGGDSFFWAPKPLKIQFFRGHQAPMVAQPLYSREHN